MSPGELTSEEKELMTMRGCGREKGALGQVYAPKLLPPFY